MKYHYEKPDIAIPVYGVPIALTHPVYKCGTLFKDEGMGFVVVQKIFNQETHDCYWGCVDPAIANDIFLSPAFPKFFKTFAKPSDYNIYQLRQIMWSLRMKPLKKEFWEEYF